jgi:hypothetical protein
MEAHVAAPLADSSALRSTLLLFLLAFPVYFMLLVLHEGGHALHILTTGGGVTLFFVHPFPMAGYALLPRDWNNVWFHVSGPALVLAIALLSFVLAWKHRSVSRLPLVMLFPWAAIVHGVVMLSVMDDFANIAQLTGISPNVFRLAGSMLAVLGIFLFVSLFPLLGLSPSRLTSLVVVPASLLLWALAGLAIGYLIVPGSPAEAVYGLGETILVSAKSATVLYLLFGLLLAGTYVTLYRWLYPRLPAWLRTEAVGLTWDGLAVPALVAAVSVVLGVMIIT